MFLTKNSKITFLILIPAILFSCTAMSMKKTPIKKKCKKAIPKIKIGPLDGKIQFLTTKKISKKTAATISKDQSYFHGNKYIDVAVVSNGKNVTIWDIQSNKKIFELRKKTVKKLFKNNKVKLFLVKLGRIKQTKQPLLTLFDEFDEKTQTIKKIYYNIETKKSSFKNIDHEQILFNHTKITPSLQYFATSNDLLRMSIYHTDFILKIDSENKSITIEHKKDCKQININNIYGTKQTDNSYEYHTCEAYVSPKKKNKYLVLHKDNLFMVNGKPSGKSKLEVYDNLTGKKIDNIHLIENKKGISFSISGIFGKHHNFLFFSNGNYINVYDLENRCFVLQEKLTKDIQELRIDKTKDDKLLLVASDKYIYVYDNPITSELKFKKKDFDNRVEYLVGNLF